ncbi:MAG: MarR family transcriptional regulator [Caldilineaceae bacterium]|nr:MarR family transcriptional regulator [Caldilineaceae bacterium]
MSQRQELIDALSRAVNAYERSNDALDDAVADHLDINRTDLRCLDWLFDGPMAAGQLAEAAGLSSAAMTTLLDRLEAKGLVRRVRATSDRRKVLVEMTQRCRRLAAELYGPIVAEGATLLEPLSDAELMLLRDFLMTSRALTDKHRARIRRLSLEPD